MSRRHPALLALTLAALAAAGALLAPAPVFAQAAFSFYGTTVGGATFNRPNTTPTPPTTLSGKIVRYSSQALFTNSNGNCTFISVQEAGFDGTIFLYSGCLLYTSPSPRD